MKKNNSECLICGFTPEQILKGIGYIRDIFSSIEKTALGLIAFANTKSKKKIESNKTDSKKDEAIKAEAKIVNEKVVTKEKSEDGSNKKTNKNSKVALHFSDLVRFEDSYIRVTLNDGSIIDLDDEIIKNMEEFECKLDSLKERFGDRIVQVDLLSLNENLPSEVS